MTTSSIDRERLAVLTDAEVRRFVDTHPRSQELHERAHASLTGAVPMTWMRKWAGPFPVYVDHAEGSRFTDVDGHDYVDLCLGDTGAMTGHSPPATVAAIRAQAARGITTMLPTEDGVVVAEELRRRFGLARWQFTLSATDANRHALRYARHLTKRPKVVVHEWCYHGSVDETFAVLDDSGATVERPGNIGPPVALAETTRVVAYNDVDGLSRALGAGDVAAVLMEPALTNIGIVLPDDGYLEACRRLTHDNGALWVVDETHTLSVGPGGWTGTHGLHPDMLTVGKPLGAGIACGAFGMSEACAAAVDAHVELDEVDVGGIGGTLAGNALSLAAMRATLTEVLTDDAYEQMIAMGDRWADGVDTVIAEAALPWHCTRLGARAEYGFTPVMPRDGREAQAAVDPPLERFLHLHALNRGVLLTPFHNMALMAPTTTAADVDRHTEAFREAVTALTVVGSLHAAPATPGLPTTR